MLDSVRYAERRLRQSPGYVAMVVLTLAAAIGANTAIFSAVHGVLLQPLPIEAPDNLAVVWQTDEGGQAVVELTYRHLREWTGSGSTFVRAAVMGSHNWSAVLQGRGEPSRIWFNGVSSDFFDTLGVRPLIGRGLRPEDDVRNAPRVAVLNYGTWVRRFAASPDVVGTTMMLDGNTVEIVGVMPSGLDVPRGAEFWTPVVPLLASGTSSDTQNLEAVGVFYVIGRVRERVDPAALRAEVNALEARLDAANAGRRKWGASAVVTSLIDHLYGPVRPALHVLWAAVVVLLLVACANVSALLLTRILTRRQEDAVRRALGATPAAIARIWLLEVVVLTTAGGLAGLAVARGLTRAIVTLAPDDIPRLADIDTDSAVALFTFGVVLFVALVIAAIPLHYARRDNLSEAAARARSTAGPGSLRLQSTMLMAQIAMVVVLLVGAVLVVRNFIAIRQIDLGFSPEGLTVQPGTTLPGADRRLVELLEQIRRLPGVEAAGGVYLRPLMLGPIGQAVPVFLEGQTLTGEVLDASPTLNYQVATAGYFEAMKIRLRAGRVFTDRDTGDVPRVAVVSESTARRLWPGQDPIGRRLLIPHFSRDPETGWRTVVGVVSDVRYRGIDEVQLDVYDPALQASVLADNIVIRAPTDPLALAAPVRALVRRLDPAAIIDDITTMEAVVRRAEAPWRLTMWLFVAFAVLAFALAALGIFAVVAMDVSHRGREFAIRTALGETGGGLVRRVLLRVGWRVLAGVILGLGAAFIASRGIRALLFAVEPDDGLTYLMVLGLVVIVGLAAAYVPARRAAAADPQTLLRQ